MVTARALSVASVITLCACSSQNAQNVDAGKSTDGSAASGEDYSPWWDPTCKTRDGLCDTCRPAQLTVWQTKCGASMTIMAGCIPSDSVTDGWGCYVRLDDGQIVQTEASPMSLDGFTSCIDAGLTNVHGYFYAQCADGGGD